jgi:light-regulated signal transduction histidine kinase (bacteriophytochrome)
VGGLREEWLAAVRTGAERFAHEVRLRRAADGEYRWHLAYAVPLGDSTGAVVQWVGSFTDIHLQCRQAEVLEGMVVERTADLVQTNLALQQEIEERKRAELKQKALTTDLKRSNEELEKFAYVASHDLQEPLRKIQAFGDRLRTKYGDQLDDQATDYVQRMQSAAARMQQLINDLLSFSRVATRTQPFAAVDLNTTLREVLSDLEVRVTQTSATVDLEPLPTIDADVSQMRQLFQNLLVNALKFHKPGVPPVIRVRSEVAPPEPAAGDHSLPRPCCRILVEDNGIGFDNRFLDRIFEMFQRLHGRGEFEGTGVGLAICRKIVEKHGGTIAADSQLGRGATFIVTLPIHQPREDATSHD